MLLAQAPRVLTYLHPFAVPVDLTPHRPRRDSSRASSRSSTAHLERDPPRLARSGQSEPVQGAGTQTTWIAEVVAETKAMEREPALVVARRHRGV